MVIGVMEGIRYRSLDAELQPDDVLLCFTDGVTEAQTATEEDYSEPRLARLVADQAECALDDLLQQIRADVARFTDTQELADDCTLLAVRRRVH
jgi:sigma-B regulation protein RsbU (phosphoserine phosphatase)